MNVNGILNINKPSGRTSYSIVAMVKQLTGERRVGHAGTLDPEATGVLPVCLGQGTRIVEFLLDTTKDYRAQLELGVATDTYDATGRVIQSRDPSKISQSKFESALSSFRGLIQQTPPMYSAVKYKGKPLYKLARAGITLERESRPARIYRLELVDWQPPLATIEVVCGKGTYIRSLVHDLGQSLGCGAYLKNLTRSRYGLFNIKDAVSVPQFEDAVQRGYWQHFVYPIDSVLLDWTAMVVDDDVGRNIRNGCSLVVESNVKGAGYAGSTGPAGTSPGEYCRVYTSDGQFFGVLRFDYGKGQWQPQKVFL